MKSKETACRKLNMCNLLIPNTILNFLKAIFPVIYTSQNTNMLLISKIIQITFLTHSDRFLSQMDVDQECRNIWQRW